MNSDDFKQSPAGRLVPTIGGNLGFVPHPLPPANLDLVSLVPVLAKATQALGELNGISRTIPNPYILAQSFLKREAVASSRIEGTVTSFDQLLLFEAGASEASTAPDAKEVHNYVRALQFALRRLEELPVCLRMINEIHEILLEGVQRHRGANFAPGKFRRDQNWIGGSGSIESARFVPPPSSELMPALDALEKYIHTVNGSNLPLLIRIALVHYQFETIHPYPDGNGRVGRLLIPLMLCEKDQLSNPVLYMSNYFEEHKNQYMDLMFEVSKTGAWTQWVEFFLNGVDFVCNDSIERLEKLLSLQADMRMLVQKARSSVLLDKLIEMLIASPVITIPIAAKALDISYNATKNNINRLVSYGILEEFLDTRPKFYIARQIFEVLRV